MQIALDEGLLHTFVSRFIGEDDRLTLMGHAPGNKWPRVVYQPHLSSFDDDGPFIRNQIDQLNTVRNVRFLPGVPKEFSEVRGYVRIKRQNGAPTDAVFSSLTKAEQDQVLEGINVRGASFKCAYASLRDAKALATAPVEPTIVVSAGDKLHAIWMLTEWVEHDDHRQIQRAIAAHFGVTFSIDDPYIPLPGCEYITVDGTRKPVTTEFWDDENTYTVAELREAFRIPKSQKPIDTQQPEDWTYNVTTTHESARKRERQFVPQGFTVGEQGVFFKDAESASHIPIMLTPLWLAGAVRAADTRETHLILEWQSHGNALESATMPVAYLADKKELSRFLYSQNVVGFSARQAERVSEYIRLSVAKYNAERATETAYTRFGWAREGFVIGSEIVRTDGIAPANVIRVPVETRDGLNSHGSLSAWIDATALLNHPDYWPHRFTLQAILGAPLLKLLNADSAVLSLAGESGTGKTTIAEFGLSAYGKPKVLEIAPQSTEKAFQEKWRIANNLPVLCNEAATIDTKRINNILYAAANGEPRDTLTQKVELRATNHWTTLTVFTSNNHLQSLDDRLLNEAGRRRVFEITVETPLGGEIAREINDVMRDNYGNAGREFLAHVVANEAQVKSQLETALDWAYSNGVQSEDRFSAWIVAVAKVAGEIAHELGILRFDVTEPCLRAIEATKNQAQTIKTTSERVDDLITDYINANQDHFSSYKVSGSKGDWLTNDARGQIVGRFTTEGARRTAALAKGPFVAYARERGIDAQHIARHCKEERIEEKTVRLFQQGKATRCLVVPLPDGESIPAHLRLVNDKSNIMEITNEQ